MGLLADGVYANAQEVASSGDLLEVNCEAEVCTGLDHHVNVVLALWRMRESSGEIVMQIVQKLWDAID